MDKYDAYDLAIKVLNKMNNIVNNPIFSTGEQLLTADKEYLCKQLEPIVEAYKILKGEEFMTQEDKKRIIEFCNNNLHTHTDWTGTYVETQYKCESVDDFVNKLLNYIEEHE